MIICIETSTPVCSATLCDRSGVIDIRESHDGRSHASLLTVFIEDLLGDAGLSVGDLEAVAVSKGPGSYTGLRIGVSVAKGMAFGASIPLIGIETPLSMFFGLNDEMKKSCSADETTLFCPMLDARRMEVYYALFDTKGKKTGEITAAVIDENSFSSIPEQVRIIFFGDGAAKCSGVIGRNNICFAGEFSISAGSMARPAYNAIDVNRYEDTAYFEPFYLKDFVTTSPVKNIPGR